MIYVAAYCRVSTDKKDQANSFESQKKFFEEQINKNPDWKIYQIYADEGLSGTSTKKRNAFNKMIEDAHLGKFTIILTKEVSRFARNTVDTLQYTRDLSKIGVGVHFILDNINTLNQDGELRLTIMASIAQEESRKTSERVKWGQTRQMEKGVVFGSDCLGYKVKNGKLYIDEYGAKIVKIIFHKFVNENKGCSAIARELYEEGYKTITGLITWSNGTILKTLRNEKYCGDLLQKKTVTVDFLTHEKKYNKGNEEMIYIKDHHEPIISRELWNKAQCILNKKSPLNKEKYTNRYPLSGKIKCGLCGHSFTAKYKHKERKTPYKGWLCQTHSKYGNKHIDKSQNEIGCDMKSMINEKDFLLILQIIMININIDKEKIINELCDVLNIVLNQNSSSENDLEYIKKKIKTKQNKSEMLLDLYLEGNISKEEYKNRKDTFLAEITTLKKRIFELENNKDSIRDINQKADDIKLYIKDVLTGVIQDENFYKFILNKIVVNSKEEMDVYLNSLPHCIKVIKNTIK